MKKLLSTLFFIIVYNFCFDQGEIDSTQKILVRNEFSFGFGVKNNGILLDYRSGKFVNYYKKNVWQVGFSTIRHSQEFSQNNPVIQGYGNYCFGKLNSCFDFHYEIGRQRTFFHKHDQNSVEIRFLYFGGASLALLKPIYYQVYYSVDDVREEKYIDSHYASVILGKCSFFKGFDEIKVNPGIYAKFLFSFEFAKRDYKLCALEGGINLKGYAKKLEILAQKNNPQFFAELFVGLRFGRIKHGAQYEYLNEYEKYD